MHGTIIHPLDPNYIDFGEDRAYYIMGDDHGDIMARVDREDYWYFCQWRWAVKYDKHGKKPYLYRKIFTKNTASNRTSLFLHVAVQVRTGIPQPLHHSMVDHEDGDSLNCRRYNLSWATPSMNRRNIRGQRSMRL